MRRNSRTGGLPCEIRVRETEEELAVCVCLEGDRGCQREVKTGGREEQVVEETEFSELEEGTGHHAV